jgi:outer membrane receptor protein involved in Fe transport
MRFEKSYLLALALLAALPLPAQVTTGTVYTIVTDPSGAVIGGVSVNLRNDATGAVRQQVCDDTGECGFTFLPPGSYTVSLSAPGFKTLEVSGLQVESAQNIRRRFTLSLGEVVEKVAVSGAAPLVNAVSTEQLESMGGETLTQLPVGHRRASELFQIDTSVSRTPGTSNTTGSFRVNGLGPGATSMTMDGIPASAHPGSPQGGFRGGFNYIEIASMEAIETVDIAKGVFSAEYGRAMSGNINVVTKTGTNQWHGSLFHLFNVDELNARPIFLAAKPPATFNQFGGSLGGPIIKNRVFIFGVYEGYRDRRSGTINGAVPTPRLRDAMIANTPAYKLVLDNFFLPNQPFAASAATAAFIGPAPIRANTDHFVIKPDVYVTGNQRLTATWTRDRPDLYQLNGPAKNAARSFTGVLDRFNITYTTFRAAWSAETRFGWNRVDNTRLDTFFDVSDPNKQESKLGGRRVPGISALGFGIQGEDNFIGHAPQWNIEQKITWQIGRHSLKAGGILSRRRFGEGDVGNPVLMYNTEQDLVGNSPVDDQFNFGFEPWVGRQIDFGFFVQDDWRVSRKLVLNLGLRYDYFDHMIAEGLHGGPPHFALASFSNFARFVLSDFRPYDNAYNSDPFSMGPRLGFAYNPDGNGKTVVRGGAGFMHAPVNTSIFEQSAINSFSQPFRIDLSRTEVQRLGLKFPVYNEDVLPLVSNGSVAPAYQLVDPQIHTPYAINYTLGIERALTNSLMFETAFVGTRGVKFVLPRIYNQPDPITGIRPNPDLGQSRYWDNSDSSTFTSWQTSLRKRYSKNLSGTVHYTWGKTLAYMWGDITYAIPTFIQDFFDVKSNRGRPPTDIQHSLVGSFVYDIPLFGGARPLLKNTLGGWQGSGVFRAQTGYPISATEASARAFGRPDLIDPAHAVVDKGLQFLNRAAFLAVPVSSVSGQQIRAGNEGNGYLTGPGLWSLDFSLSKNFHLTERVQFQFRADMLNALNHANLNVVETNLNNARFGQRTGSTDQRVIQFHTRLSF